MSKNKYTTTLEKIRILPQELDNKQPLARFMITLFNLFEDEVIAQLENTPYKDITRTDLNSLRYIDQNGITISQMAKLAGISKQAMSKQIESLSERSLVKSTQDTQDARARKVILTDKGAKLVFHLVEIIRDIELKYQRKIGKVRYEKLKADLNILIHLY